MKVFARDHGVRPVPGNWQSSRASDDSVLNGAPGVLKVVKLPNAVAVVATDTYWRAKRALSRLQPQWDVGAAGTIDSEQLSSAFRAALSDPMLTARNQGDVDKAMLPAPPRPSRRSTRRHTSRIRRWSP